MSDFTPGPWQVSNRKARRVTNAHGVVICNAVLRNQGGPKCKLLKSEHEAEANAELIAAAPCLLGQHDSNLVDLDMLRRAVVEGDPKAELLVRIDDLVRRSRAAIAKAQS